MTQTPSAAQIAQIATCVPTFEMFLRDAAARAHEPGLADGTRIGLLQAVVGYARVVRGYRAAAGLGRAWPEDLWRVLSDLSDFAQQRAQDAGLATRHVLEFYRVGQGLAQAVLLALPPASKPAAPARMATIVEPTARMAPSLHQALRQAVASGGPISLAARAA